MPEQYTLSPKEQAFIRTYTERIQAIQNQMNVALGLIVTQQGLEGSWKLNEAGTELVRVGGQ